ncbi:hypothetical protein IP93_02448 [Lysobacter ruishenii]|uniref:Uncharacterized protein n=2 Tax=Aerolutibacter ruishenii TaxID=686800 RepID=A0A562LKS2_9GAMM|nr:hypothetical protein IP93_02448 [Lysobacter ruishenii]
MTGTRHASHMRLRRLVLASFVITFLSTRILVYLIMSRQLPDLYLHLGGSYWQRSSFDAVVAIFGLLALLAFGGTLRRLRPRLALLLLVTFTLAAYFAYVFRDYERLLATTGVEHLHRVEVSGPR